MVDGVGAGIGMGSTGLAEGGGYHFGVSPNVEQTLLVVGVEASLVINMMAFLCHRMWEIWGDFGKGGPLGGMMAGVDGMAGVEGTVGTRVVSESSP